MIIRPRRSVLYMPGSNARAIEKARPCPPTASSSTLKTRSRPTPRSGARSRWPTAVKDGGFGSREVFIRVNGIDTPWHADDLTAAAQAAPDAILVPKVSHPDQLEMIGQRLLDMHTPVKTRVWAMIETPLAILNILAIAAAARDSETRLAGFVMGTNDLAKETRARLVPGPRADAAVADRPALLPRAFTASRFSTASTTISAMRKASSPNASRASTSASTARRSFIRTRSSRATRRSRRARTKSRRRARSSRRSNCRRTSPRAWSRSTAAWSSACMPTWRGARWRSRTRSRPRAPERAAFKNAKARTFRPAPFD